MSIIKHLDEVAEVDRGIGSVNTVVNDGGRLTGYGSDGPGALQALLDAGVRVEGKRVTIIGSGGAARAIAFTLAAKARPAALYLLGVIEPELRGADARPRAQDRRAGDSARCWSRGSCEARLSESQVLIHCTPVGMHPNTKESVVPKALLHRDLAVMDIVYNPLEDQAARRRRGARPEDDLGRRDVRQPGGDPVRAVDRQEGAARRHARRGARAPRRQGEEAMNLVLIGYRGTGKSTVATLLAARLGMEVVSLDDEIVRQAGRPIPEIVAQHGWPHFRDLESEVTERVAARDGLIIDAGGGVILRPENVSNLKRGGTLFWLRASVPVIVARIEGGSAAPGAHRGEDVHRGGRGRPARAHAAVRSGGRSSVDTDERSSRDRSPQRWRDCMSPRRRAADARPRTPRRHLRSTHPRFGRLRRPLR